MDFEISAAAARVTALFHNEIERAQADWKSGEYIDWLRGLRDSVLSYGLGVGNEGGSGVGGKQAKAEQSDTSSS